MIVDIKDIHGNICFSTPINKGSKRKLLLMKEDYITLKFSLDKPVYFHLGDGIDNELGMYELVDLYKPEYNAETSGYDYDLRLDAYYWKWKNKKFFYTPENGGREAGWNLTATLETHMKAFLKNLEHLGYKFREQPFSAIIDTSVDTSAKLISYDNVNLIDALTQMAETWQCEWWITNSVIHFGRCEYESAVDFDINNNVSEMTRSDSQSDYATRIYAFGSTKNIPTDYRPVDEDTVVNGIVQKRLMLPDGITYIDAYPEMSAEEAIEEIVVFEDVYPRRVGKMSAVTPYSYTDKTEEEGKEPVFKKWNAYRYRDTGINFSEKYVLPGQELRIIFQSGALNGMSFAVTFNPCDKDKGEKPQPEKNKDGSWNYLAQVFEIVRNEEYGRPLPDDSLKPANGDEFVLYGFDTKFVSDAMLPEAEQELLETAKKYIEKMKTDPSTYNCKMKPEFIYNDGDIVTYELGDKVNLFNEAYFEGGRQSRIIGYECSLDIPYDHPVYIVGETAAYSRLGAIENKVDSLTYKGKAFSGAGASGGSGPGVYVIGQNDRTLPSDRNVFSSKKSLKTFLNKMEPDTAVGHVTFENGILVRQQEIMEASAMALIEEGEAIVEELAIRSDIMTLGEINNVSQEADESSETNDVIVRLAGASQWTVNSTLLADVLQLKEKVFPFTMSLTGGGTFEKGSAQTIGLSWSYDREITSQSINGEALDVDVRTRQYEDIDSDTSYTLSAESGGQIYTRSASVVFRLKKYYGVSDKEALTNEEILALSTLWAERGQGSTVFDCTGGKYVYYILPQSMSSGIQFWVGGLRNSDWVEEVREITNAYGHTERYIIFRLNSIQTGVLNLEVK